MSDGSCVISDIVTSTNDGLQWISDTNSGVNMSPNSRLVVGPVNQAYNQLSYQSIFTTLLSGTIKSSIAALTEAATYVYTQLV